MLLGFKRRFEPFVLDGSKAHTIRAKRKLAPKVGETCHCYVDPRQRTMRLLGRWKCVKVEDIEIEELPSVFFGDAGVVIRINGEALSADECNALAWADGFRTNGREGAFEEMVAFWRKDHRQRGGPLEFHGDVVHWRYDAAQLASRQRAASGHE